MHSLVSLLVLATTAILPVFAQVSEWGQCGGIDYTGGTVCVSGTTCVYSNAYYSQCLPGSASSSTPTTIPPSSPTSSSSAPTSTSTTWEGYKSIKYFFTFGDSYTDTGFNPNGVLPNPSNPLGNPAFPGSGTSSGGEMWPDYMAYTYNQTETFIYNFAISGATLDSSLAAPYSSSVLSVRQQIEQEFLPGLGNKPSTVPWAASNSLFGIFDGINDVLNIDGNPNQASAIAPFQTVYSNLVSELYAAGARNFLFIGVPAIDQTPFVAQQGAANPGLAKTSLTAYNNMIKGIQANLTAQHPDVNTFYEDSDALFIKILANPTAYGVANDSAAWANTLHPVPAIQKALAADIASVLG